MTKNQKTHKLHTGIFNRQIKQNHTIYAHAKLMKTFRRKQRQFVSTSNTLIMSFALLSLRRVYQAARRDEAQKN